MSLPTTARRRPAANGTETPQNATVQYAQAGTTPRLPAVAPSRDTSHATSTAASSRARTPHAHHPKTAANLAVVNLTAQAGPELSIEHALLNSALERRQRPHAPGLSPPLSSMSRLYPTPPTDSALSTSRHNTDPTLYRRITPFVPRPLPTSLVQQSPVINYWLNQLEWEKRQDYTADLVIWEAQLSEMLAKSGFDDLTPQRVSLVCDLVDQISAHVGRWAPILRRIVRELFASIYQGYDIEELEVRVPIWSQEGASWIGWQTPTFGNTLDNEELDSIMSAPSFHPLSPLSDAHMYGAGGQTGGDAARSAHLAPPPKPTDPEPPLQHFFRHHLFELNHATWSDLMIKYENAQHELIAHRIRVAQDLGMTLTQDGQRIVVQSHDDAQTQEQLTPFFRPRPPPLRTATPGTQSVSLFGEKHESEHGDVPTPLHSPFGAMHTLRLDRASSGTSASSFTPRAGGSSVGALSDTSVGSTMSSAIESVSIGSTPRAARLAQPAHSSMRSISLNVSSPPLGSSTPMQKNGRPMSSLHLQRQLIIDDAKSAVLADRESMLLGTPRSSSKVEPLTAQSMATLESTAVGALVEQAMKLTKADESPRANPSNGGVGSPRFRSLPSEEAKEQTAHANGTAGSTSVHRRGPSLLAIGPPAASSATALAAAASVSTTEAVTAAAFQTINMLMSTPPIPSTHLIAYFDVNKRLNMQYDNLYKRIRNWAQKQTEMQNATSTRDMLLNRISRKLKYSLYVSLFTRWREVVIERKRQAQAFQQVFARFHHSPSHLAQRFLAWRIIALRRKTAALDRSVKDTAMKNMILDSEICEQKYIRDKELTKKDVLRAKDIELTKDRDEIEHFLQLCHQQIQDVQGAQATRLISSTLSIMQNAISTLWGELKEAREANLQDPCRMLVSSTVLTELVNKPYTHMVEASPEWVAARRDEVKRTRLRFQNMLDSDLLLLWFNYHLAQAHLAVNQDKLQAKFYGRTYKYDAPNSGYPQHVRTFYSSDSSLVRRAENFTSSLQDCEVLLRLLSQIAPHLCDVDILVHVDLEVRGKKLLRLMDALNSDVASMITSMDLTHSFSPDLTAALIARLMMNNTSMPVDSSIFQDRRRKRKSEYAPDDKRILTADQQSKANDMKKMTDELGLSDAAAAKAQEMMAEEARADALVAEAAAEKRQEEEDELHRQRPAKAATKSSKLKKHQRGSVFDHRKPSQHDLDEEEAERAVKDCGPFTELARALHLVSRELNTRARVEVNLVSHISGNVRKVLNDVRVMLDDAYERHQLWLTVRRRVGAFVSLVMTHQMRGEPLVMQDRKSIRQIRRYTKLIDRTGKPQARFNDLLHPFNRTSNDVAFQRRGIEEEDEDEDDDSESDDDAEKKSDADESASESSSSSSDSDSDSSDDGSRTIDGDDIWREYKPMTAKALGLLPPDEQEREQRRLRERNETTDDLTTQMTFELTKMQEMIAKHYTSIRDIFRAYAQMDTSTEQAFKTREEERGGGVAKGHKSQQKEDRDDPTAAIRRKLREQHAANFSTGSGSSHSAAVHAEANPQFGVHEFWLMVRDSRLITKHFTPKKIERIFEYVWARDLKAALLASGHIDSSPHAFDHFMKDKSRAEIDCRQFVEILIRIAHQRMPSQKEREELIAEVEQDREQEMDRKRTEGIDISAGEISDIARQMDALTRASISTGHTSSSNAGGATGVNGANVLNNPMFEWGTPLFPTTRPGWALRLFGLVRCRLIPSAARLNVDTFRNSYKRMEVSVLYKKHSSVLRKLFYRYAKMHSVRGRSMTDSADADEAHAADAVWTNTIDYKEFIALLRDSKLLDGRFLSLQQVYAIFANVQADLAKVAPPVKESDAKEKKNKRASLRGSLRLGAVVLQAQAAAAASTNVADPPVTAPEDTGSGVWGSSTLSGSVVNTLADLNLESQAADMAIVPTDEQILASSATSNTELTFTEFQESLAAIACVRHPNPYKSIQVRLEHFLNRDLLPWASLLFATTTNH